MYVALPNFVSPSMIRRSSLKIKQIAKCKYEVIIYIYYKYNYSGDYRNLALSLAKNGVIFHYNHLCRGDYSGGRTNFQISHLALCQCVESEEEINLMMPFRGIPNTPQSS